MIIFDLCLLLHVVTALHTLLPVVEILSHSKIDVLSLLLIGLIVGKGDSLSREKV